MYLYYILYYNVLLLYYLYIIKCKAILRFGGKDPGRVELDKRRLVVLNLL